MPSNGAKFPVIFSFVPWRHHIEILSKCKSIDEALFYLKMTIKEGWSRNTLMNCIKGHYYENLGGAITNFADKLPSPQSELAQAITKDTYDFGFISLEDGYKEEALETELEKQLTRFLLELGTGFAYMGRQKQLVIAGKTRKLDMLFFHIPLNCYVVVELKGEILGIKEMIAALGGGDNSTADQWMDLDSFRAYHPDKPARATVYEWVSLKKVPVHKDGNGKRLRFLKSEIDEWLTKGRQ